MIAKSSIREKFEECCKFKKRDKGVGLAPIKMTMTHAEKAG